MVVEIFFHWIMLLKWVFLAARVLTKLNLSKCAISELASEVIGVDYVVATSSNIGVTLDKKAIAFTYEEIKCAIQEASLYML